MIDAFVSVGGRVFDVSLIDIDETKRGFQVSRADELKRSVSARLEAATRTQTNIIIRPRSTTALLIQLDDIDETGAARIALHAFMTVRTSPANYQIWLAVSDGPKDGTEAARQLKKRVRMGAGADKSATGAVRLAGSLNIKHKYAPDFPIVTLGQVEPGKIVTIAELATTGLIAPLTAITPPRGSVPEPTALRYQQKIPTAWPDYRRALQGAPMNSTGKGPDRSKADYMFCKWAAERGWNKHDIAAKLGEVSDKAQDAIRRGDVYKNDLQKGYCLLTAENACAAAQRALRPVLKSTPQSAIGRKLAR